MVIDDLSAPLEDLASAVEAMLTEVAGRRARPFGGGWQVGDESSELHCYLVELPAEEERAPERVLEFVRPVRDLGFAGRVTPDEARAALRVLEGAHLTRFAVGAHPSGNRRLALLQLATLHLEDLDERELRAAMEEFLDRRLR